MKNNKSIDVGSIFWLSVLIGYSKPLSFYLYITSPASRLVIVLLESHEVFFSFYGTVRVIVHVVDVC